MQPDPRADSLSSVWQSEADLRTLVEHFHDPRAAESLARRLLPWLHRELQVLACARTLPGLELPDATQDTWLALLLALARCGTRQPGKLRRRVRTIAQCR